MMVCPKVHCRIYSRPHRRTKIGFRAGQTSLEGDIGQFWCRRVLTTSGAALFGDFELIFPYFFQVAEATGRRLGPFAGTHDASFAQDSFGGFVKSFEMGGLFPPPPP